VLAKVLANCVRNVIFAEIILKY